MRNLQTCQTLHYLSEEKKRTSICIILIKVAMYRIYDLRLDPNFTLWPVADKFFYLLLTVETMHEFAFFIAKYLQP